MDDDYVDFLRYSLARGCDLNTALAAIRLQGAGPIASIKAIRKACSINLCKAKDAFENSRVWDDIREDHDKFIDELTAAFESANKSE